MRFSLPLAVGWLLSSCASVPQDRLVFIRTDGQPIRGNAALAQQAEIDATVCTGQTQQSALGAPIVYEPNNVAGVLDGAIVSGQRQGALGDVARGCMAQKGYLQVRESEMDQKLAEFRQTASARKKIAQ